MKWVSNTVGGPRRVNHAAAAVGDKIYSFGGFCTGDNYSDVRPIDVFELNTANNRWKEIPTPDVEAWTRGMDQPAWPRMRFGHSVVSYNGKLILFGGRADYYISNAVHVFDPHTREWSFPKCTGVVPPSTRDGHSACVIGNKMVVFGGYAELLFHSGIGNLCILDLDTWEWSIALTRGEAPDWRDFHTATPVGHKMYIFGGRCVRSSTWMTVSDEYYTNTISYLDMDTMTWFTPQLPVEAPCPGGRRSHSSVNIDGRIFVFGGYNSQTKVHMSDTWIFDTEKCTWEEITVGGERPTKRRRQVMIKVDTKIFLFGGTAPYDGPLVYYNDEQMANMPPEFRDGHSKLIDLNDTHVLDLKPTLQTLCMVRVLDVGSKEDLDEFLKETGLPIRVQEHMKTMYASNSISLPLQFHPLISG